MRGVLQTHTERKFDEHLTVWTSCANDDGRPIGISFQERIPNQSKLLCLRGMVVSVGSKVRRKYGQVSIRETSASEPSITRRKALQPSKPGVPASSGKSPSKT